MSNILNKKSQCHASFFLLLLKILGGRNKQIQQLGVEHGGVARGQVLRCTIAMHLVNK
jgi:hypothetical protein